MAAEFAVFIVWLVGFFVFGIAISDMVGEAIDYELENNKRQIERLTK